MQKVSVGTRIERMGRRRSDFLFASQMTDRPFIICAKSVKSVLSVFLCYRKGRNTDWTDAMEKGGFFYLHQKSIRQQFPNSCLHFFGTTNHLSFQSVV